jgi:hypothetical protein
MPAAVEGRTAADAHQAPKWPAAPERVRVVGMDMARARHTAAEEVLP